MLTQRSHHPLGITLPITTEFRQIAQQFAQQCPFSDKAQQIQRNTLAVCAVNAYLQLMDIPTSLDQSDSWSPMMRMMADVADLAVPDIGSLSCRPVAPDDTVCVIPPEDWHDRAGYIAVVIDEVASQATLVGFTASVTEEGDRGQMNLADFAPIEALIDHIHHLQTQASTASATVSSTSSSTAPENSPSLTDTTRALITQLDQWIEGRIADSWQAVDALINPDRLNFAFRTMTESRPARNAAIDISRAKLLDLGLQLGETVRVALIVRIIRTAERTIISTTTEPTDESDFSTSVILQVRPVGGPLYLPEGLSLTLLDESENTLKSTVSELADDCIQFRLSGEPGETFGVQVAIDETCFEERFII